MRGTFLNSAPDNISPASFAVAGFLKSEGDTARLPRLFTLLSKVHSLTRQRGRGRRHQRRAMASALEALLKELYESQRTSTPPPSDRGAYD